MNQEVDRSGESSDGDLRTALREDIEKLKVSIEWDYARNQPMDITRHQAKHDPSFARDAVIIAGGYSWAGTYSAGSDAMIYRRFKGPLPAHVPVIFARDNPPAHIVAFCEENNCDVALYDELRGIVRKPRLGTDEAP